MVNSTDFKAISSSDYKGELALQQAAKSDCIVLHAVKCHPLCAPPDPHVPPSRALAHPNLLCESLPLLPERTLSSDQQLTPRLLSNTACRHPTAAERPALLPAAGAPACMVGQSAPNQATDPMCGLLQPADFSFVCPTELREIAGRLDKDFKSNGAEVSNVTHLSRDHTDV